MTSNNGVPEAPSYEVYDVDEDNGSSTAAGAADAASSPQSIDRGGFLLQSYTGEDETQLNFLKDRIGHQTFARRIALWLSENYSWYNPQLLLSDDEVEVVATTSTTKTMKKDGTVVEDKPVLDEKPSLAKAWAFFEHVTLPRYVVEGQDALKERKYSERLHNRMGGSKNQKMRQLGNKHKSQMTKGERIFTTFLRGDRKLEKAEPGENELKTKLYSPITTPLSQMGDFGLGYGLYFSTLRYIAMLSLLAGILNLSSLLYFASNDYSSNEQADISAALLKGSAICTDTQWVPCVTCIPEYFEQLGAYTTDRFVGFFEFVKSTELYGGEGYELYLNVTEYVEWNDIDVILDDYQLYLGEEEYDFGLRDELFTQEKFYQPLEDKYGIRFESNQIVFLHDNNSTLPCGQAYADYYDDDWAQLYINEFPENCLALYTWCQQETIHECYLYVEDKTYNNGTLIRDFYRMWVALAKKNNCVGATFRQGYVNLATVILVILGAMIIRYRQNQLEEEFDEDEQTAQDYSITIRNPPPDAYDPEEWKTYFETTFDNCIVRVCTVDVSNDKLVQDLVKRRELLHSLEIQLPANTIENGKLEEEIEKARDKRDESCFNRLTEGLPGLYDELEQVTADLTLTLAEAKERPTTDIFVTFETEEAQRNVLKTLTVGGLAVRTNDIDALPDPKYLFQGHLVLDVVEPADEPSSIRWQELDATMPQIVWSLIRSSLIAFMVLILCFVVVLSCYELLPAAASYVTTICTIVFPMVATSLMEKEVHKSESSRQTWLFIKITIFNVAITALLLSIYTPFIATLEDKQGSVLGLIPAVHALFFSQLVISPIMQMLDIGGTISKHFFAPRAKTQEQMNMAMLGSQVYLAERYANLMKFIYLMLWFCAIYPAGFFMGSFALFVVYFADRFSLMRSWARTPQLGTQISDFARNVFTPAAIVIMAVSSSYYWSGFPFDNLCEDPNVPLIPSYVRDIEIEFNATEEYFLGMLVYNKTATKETVSITNTTQNYKPCRQDLRAYRSRSFPPLPKFQDQEDPWMTEDQEKILNVYGWFGVFVLTMVLLKLLSMIGNAIFSSYRGSYTPRGRDMKIPYSDCAAIDSYIPSVYSPLFAYPLLLCDVSNVDTKLFDWTDPEKEHSYYDITRDAKELAGNKALPEHLFSQVKYWPPDQ